MPIAAVVLRIIPLHRFALNGRLDVRGGSILGCLLFRGEAADEILGFAEGGVVRHRHTCAGEKQLMA